MRVLPVGFAILAVTGCLGGPAPAEATGRDFAENFDGAEEMPVGWEEVAGRWSLVDAPDAPTAPHIVSGFDSSGGTALFVAKGNGTFSQGTITAQVHLERFRKAGFVLRFVDPQNYERVEVELRDKDWGFHHTLVFGGKSESRAFSRFESAQPPGWHTLSVQFDAETLRVNLDTASAGGTQSSRLSVGSVGLASSGGLAARFDDVQVSPSTASTGSGPTFTERSTLGV